MSWDVPVCPAHYRGSNDKVLREDHLQLLENSDILMPCTLSVTQRHLIFCVQGNQEVVLPWEYVYGCHCLRGRQNTSESALFCVYTYPPARKQKLGSIHQRQVFTFVVDIHKTNSENMDLAKSWQAVILNGVRQSIPEDHKVPNPQLPYLIFVNRKSGNGRGFSIFEKIVNPVFGEADVPYELVLTERANHARELVGTTDLSRYRGIVVVSGDGLIFEVLNGLFEREDWQNTVSSVPIGVVAAGSGNGLASSLCFASGMSMIENMPLHNALILAKPMKHSMDVVRVETPLSSLVSFLSITWALIADIDIQSERLRSLGVLRFTVAAVAKIIGSRTYRGTISFLPATPYHPERRLPLQRRNSSPAAVGSGSWTRPSERRTASDSIAEQVTDENENNNSAAGEDVFPTDRSPPARPPRRRLHRSMTTSGMEEEHDLELETSPDSNGDLELEDLDRRPMTTPLFKCPEENEEAEELHCQKPAETMRGERRYLVPLDKPVPDDWVTITDRFVVFCAAYQTHIASDAQIMPHGRLNDGLIYLMLMRSGVPRSNLFNIMTSIESGNHLKSPYLEVIPVYAFRLVPHTPDGILTVDGERVDYGPIQAEVAHQRVSVITACPNEKGRKEVSKNDIPSHDTAREEVGSEERDSASSNPYENGLSERPVNDQSNTCSCPSNEAASS